MTTKEAKDRDTLLRAIGLIEASMDALNKADTFLTVFSPLSLNDEKLREVRVKMHELWVQLCREAGI